MKKRGFFLTVFILSLVLVTGGCLKDKINGNLSLKDISLYLLSKLGISSGELVEVKDGSEYMKKRMENVYKIKDFSEYITDSSLYLAKGARSDEIALFKVSDKKILDTIKDSLKSYIEERIPVFQGYAPSEEYKLKNAETGVIGDIVYMAVCSEPRKAKGFLNEALTLTSDELKAVILEYQSSDKGDDASFTDKDGETMRADKDGDSLLTDKDGETLQAEKESANNPNGESSHMIGDYDEALIYDDGNIVKAYMSGDTSSLDKEELYVYNVSLEAIKNHTDDSMSLYEKELAIHDYIVSVCEYDEGMLDDDHKNPNPFSNRPYGVLIEKSGICSGYTNTFKLFMDLLGIDCITVSGHANGDNIHAWNKVCLDGDWYNVDTTWDDPVYTTGKKPDNISHAYFNVTDKKLKKDHSWEEADYPEAKGTKYSFKSAYKKERNK